MTRVIVIACISAVLVAAPATILADDDDTVVARRVAEFLTSVHTAQSMRVEEWFTPRAANTPIFVGFGGLDAMVRDSTARANRHGGLGSVSISRVSREGKGYVVTAEVKFQRDHRDPSSPVASDREDMIWELHLIESGGRWKIWK